MYLMLYLPYLTVLNLGKGESALRKLSFFDCFDTNSSQSTHLHCTGANEFLTPYTTMSVSCKCLFSIVWEADVFLAVTGNRLKKVAAFDFFCKITLEMIMKQTGSMIFS